VEPRGSGAAGRRGSGERRRGDPQRRAVRLSMRRFQVWRLPPFGWRAPTRPACGVPRLVHDAPLGSLASDSREPLPGSEGGRLNPRSGAFFAWPAADAARQVGVVRGAAASRTHCVACGGRALAFGRSRAAPAASAFASSTVALRGSPNPPPPHADGPVRAANVHPGVAFRERPTAAASHAWHATPRDHRHAARQASLQPAARAHVRIRSRKVALRHGRPRSAPPRARKGSGHGR